jgi:hypothetical protein
MASRIGAVLLTICTAVCIVLGFALALWPVASADQRDTASHFYGLLTLLVGVGLSVFSKRLARSLGIGYAVTWWFLELPLMIGSVFGGTFIVAEAFVRSQNVLTGEPNPALPQKGI